jgi:molecular chaperone HtpG
MRPMVLFKNSEGNNVTLTEYKESIPEAFREKLKDTVLYFEKEKADPALRNQLLSEGIHALETDDHIDPHFMQHAEMHKVEDVTVKFSSVDSMIGELLESEATTDEDMKIKDLFSKVLKGKEESEEGVEISKLKNSASPAYFKIDETMKRFAKMAQSMGPGSNPFPLKKTLVINPNNALIKNALRIHEKGGHQDLVEKICFHVQDLATISSEGLKNEEKDQFVQRSQTLIQDLSTLAL